MRSNITQYIASLKSRQEEEPLVSTYIDCGMCEPLHLKNNTVKEMFMKVKNIVISQAKNLFVVFIEFIRTDMNSNYLAKKLIAWFNENKTAGKERDFGFHFRGRESLNYLKGFPSLIKMLKPKVSHDAFKLLIHIFYQSIMLRDLVSY